MLFFRLSTPDYLQSVCRINRQRAINNVLRPLKTSHRNFAKEVATTESFLSNDEPLSEFLKYARFFATTLPGLEFLTVRELVSFRAMGVEIEAVEEGGVQFRGVDLEGLLKCHLHLGTVSHIYLRAGDPFVATNMSELVRKVSKMKFWGKYISTEQLGNQGGLQSTPKIFDIRVTTTKSKLYHTKGIAERVERGILDALDIDNATYYKVKSECDGAKTDSIRVLVRIVKNIAQISVDTSCTPLHRRGYRFQTGKAPLREDIAYAFLYSQGWSRFGYKALIDPMCGSGTILIEGAAMTAGLPPGRLRPTPLRYSKLWQPNLWDGIVKLAIDEATDTRESHGYTYPYILGSDRDAGVIVAAKENSKRAGVGDMIEYFNCSISSNPWFNSPDDVGADGSVLIATNPPFGRRISKKPNESKNSIYPLLPLYQTLGKYSQRGGGKGRAVQLSLIAHDFRLARTTGVDAPLTLLFASPHGGLNVGAFTTGPLSSKMVTDHSTAAMSKIS
mmetsp:Transcript_15494/g.29232  ORF Transcript_15494/g.29232 Transcript_15494/m.29232 type:complete len:503 (+) Transcript_15494:129-1637(+)